MAVPPLGPSVAKHWVDCFTSTEEARTIQCSHTPARGQTPWSRRTTSNYPQDARRGTQALIRLFLQRRPIFLYTSLRICNNKLCSPQYDQTPSERRPARPNPISAVSPKTRRRRKAATIAQQQRKRQSTGDRWSGSLSNLKLHNLPSDQRSPRASGGRLCVVVAPRPWPRSGNPGTPCAAPPGRRKPPGEDKQKNKKDVYR